ncbi:cyclic AMP-responsive element-binding protein 3-like protein 4 isoform X2 [Poeciliopsis prolifica]|uniref:cyclic AMP-responsive element-binding protein 3-like protein 4 isoform X2 n=1 Tax=Poeciliopsis prolifica TaxID=188132 RepID=UPI002413D35B|nr:cyclic AMP-responsive element-binding protein 3-like protein 4 isoform X2 [Poeciliopsis prolifica]
MDTESGAVLPGTGPATHWPGSIGFSGPREPLQDWVVDPSCVTLDDSESEDILQAVDPNEVFGAGTGPADTGPADTGPADTGPTDTGPADTGPTDTGPADTGPTDTGPTDTGSADTGPTDTGPADTGPADTGPTDTGPADTSSESDSGISEETPIAMVTAVNTETSQPSVYQVVYDISSVGGAKSEPGQENIISIELDEWSSQLLFSDSCIMAPSSSSPSDCSRSSAPLSGSDQVPLFPDLRLTEEEQKLLTEEGVSLPSNLPLTKAEERILKKVRRKIRNKQSAQDSRKRRKEYIHGLESRAAACSAQNQELQRTVEQLEKHNVSLLSQLQQLRSLIKQSASKGAQTSTCLLILLVSLSLIVLPSFSPFSRRTSADDDYRTAAVVSRNILTDPNFSNPADDGVGSAERLDSSVPPELSQSGSAGGAAALPEPIGPLEGLAGDDSSQSQNGTAAVARQTGREPGKLGHADEM